MQWWMSGGGGGGEGGGKGDLRAVAVGRAVELQWSGSGLVVVRWRVLAVEWRLSGSGG